jgi:hypothetical protein
VVVAVEVAAAAALPPVPVQRARYSDRLSAGGELKLEGASLEGSAPEKLEGSVQ